MWHTLIAPKKGVSAFISAVATFHKILLKKSEGFFVYKNALKIRKFPKKSL